MIRLILLLLASVAFVGMPPLAAAQAPRRQHDVERARHHFMEGVEAYQRGELHVAVRSLLASQRHIRSPETAFNIARCFERMGESARANHWFRAYLTHGRPDAASRADVERRMQRMTELQQRVDAQASAPGPSDEEMLAEARRFFESGTTMYRRRRYEAAMQAFVQAFRYAQFPELLFNMAATAEKLGQVDDAIGYYRLILDDHADSPMSGEAQEKIEQLRAQLRR